MAAAAGHMVYAREWMAILYLGVVKAPPRTKGSTMQSARTCCALLGAALLLALWGCDDENTVSSPREFRQPAGTAAINFSIDDTANQTYTKADGLAWKGSFSYDASTRILTRDGAWRGPFVLLWDDGPWTEGGHEPEGAIADDHIWGVAVFIATPSADEVLEYGAIRGSVDGSDGDWIWIGTNGRLTVPAGQTDALTAVGLTVRPFGSTDLRLVIDTGNLDAAFSGFDPADGVRVKGSAWGWREIDIPDDGTKGDETSGDGRFTFVLDEQVGEGTDFPHAGLLQSGDQAEFIFVLDAVEYKVGGTASIQGVTAGTRVPPLSWSAATIEINASGTSFVTAP